MAPLALVAPFIGPALDRSHGGRRWMIVAVNAVRAVVCLVMLDDLDSLAAVPQAFTVLAMGKAYGVARSALVPTVVRNDAELVEANSKLQLLSGLAAPAAGRHRRARLRSSAGRRACSRVAVVVYAAATIAALRIPTTQVAAAPVERGRGGRAARRRRRCWPRRPWGWSAGSSASSRSCCCSTSARTPPGTSASCSAHRRRARWSARCWRRGCASA